MKGHIRERSPGHWAIVLEIRDPETGKRKREWHSFEGTKRAAQLECARLIDALNRGDYVEPQHTTVRQYLDRWLEHIKTQVSPRSHERYTEIVRKNLVPLLGGVVLSRLRLCQSRLPAAAEMALVGSHHVVCITCTASCGRVWRKLCAGRSSPGILVMR